MSSKFLKNSENAIYKIWKASPKGPQQLELERLFENGLIGEFDSPEYIRTKYPIFNEFSTRVFTAHFNKTKAKYGLMRKFKIT